MQKAGSLTSSAQSTSKNKKLTHEYGSFDKKVACFLVSSANSGKGLPKSETEPLYFRCPESEVDFIRQKGETAKSSGPAPYLTSLARWHQFMAPFYTVYRQVNLSLESDKPKRNLLVRLKEMFDAPAFDASVVVYAGSMTSKGTLLIESKSFGVEELAFKDLLAEWVHRTSKQAHLLIILDCNFAGKWADELSALPEPIESVSVLAACGPTQKAGYFEQGMCFTHNLMKYLTKNQNQTIFPLPQTPRFGGNYLMCKHHTNFYLNFSSWAALSALQKADYAMIEYDNGTYVGHISAGKKHFWGSFVWKTGSFKDCRYEGEFVKGKMEGRGILTYHSGRCYVGDFKDNAPDGVARERYENGDSYEGQFRRGFKSGRGVYRYSNGEVYEGQFEDNKPSGTGKLYISKASYYEGSFKNGKCNGLGKYKYPNGDVYEGSWVDSVKHGKGVYRYANGDVYEGDFLNGLRHGQGKLTAASGDVYEGFWENDCKSGEGRNRSAEGEVFGHWRNDKLVNQTTFYQKIGTTRVQSGI